MNFEQILSAYRTKACILSVEDYGGGRYGNIRIAAGNKAHCDEMLRVMRRPFIPDSPYEQYLPQNSNFEDFCYRSAVVFCDLNGLKRVNDEEGHSAGDRILKQAAAILREVFPDSGVYRAGGDEFMILAEGMDEETAAAKRKQLHDRAAAVEGLSFSTGVHVIRGNEDIRTAMRAADGEMYADKKAYYERHPERKSR